MKPGDVALVGLPQSDGINKIRPAILLRKMPPFGDFLVCGISSKLHHEAEGFDEIISQSDSDFKQTGLAHTSLARLGFLTVIPTREIPGIIGAVSPSRYQRLVEKLSEYLIADLK
jgi:mRNA interferase MazF